jgi:CRISPR-associated endoribonuclease Cas6
MPAGAFCTLSAREGVQIDMSDLYSVVFELRVGHAVTISGSTGHLAHALFLNLIKQFDPALSASLHNLPGPKPFTISPLLGVEQPPENLTLPREQICSLRLTLLDGGDLWHRLSTYTLQTEVVQVHLGPAALRLTRLITSTSADITGWAEITDWLTLAGLPAQRVITLHFASPTAFNLGYRAFELFPKPSLIWESLLRVWNAYAPQHLKMDKQRLRTFLIEHVSVLDCDIATMMCSFSQYVQKGFVGTCTYQIHKEDEGIAANLTTLAAFARYAGIGYKTTMGMGQARALLLEDPPTREREV